MADKKYMGPNSLDTLSELIHESISKIQIPDAGLDEATVRLIIENALTGYATLDTTRELIQDAVNEALNDLKPSTENVYDNEERVIGTWFDKPLYMKVYDGSFSVESSNPSKEIGIDVTFGQTKVLKNVGGNVHFKYGSGSTTYPISFSSTIENETRHVEAYINPSKSLQLIWHWFGTTGTVSYELKVEYTKTTD